MVKRFKAEDKSGYNAYVDIKNKSRKVGLKGTHAKKGEFVPGTGYTRGSVADSIVNTIQKRTAKKVIAQNAEIQRKRDTLSAKHQAREVGRSKQFAYKAKMNAQKKK